MSIYENGKLGPEEGMAESPREFGYDMFDGDAAATDTNIPIISSGEVKPRIILMGLRR